MTTACVFNKEQIKKQKAQKLNNPEVAVLYAGTPEMLSGAADPANWSIRYVDVFGLPKGEVTIRSALPIKGGASFFLRMYNPGERKWDFFKGVVRSVDETLNDVEDLYFSAELEPQSSSIDKTVHIKNGLKQIPFPEDYEFFRRIPFLRAIHRDAVCPLLNNLTHKRARAGERIIAQGKVGEHCWIVQKGSCVVKVEKEDELFPVGQIRKGEFVGEMAIITGEPRSAHVDAETDMELWGFPRRIFESFAENYPGVRTFLTEIIADRFFSRKLTADRKIGKYIITDIIGRGGYAIVYKGLHADLRRPVAVKMLKHDMALNPDFITNFKKEARTIAKFNHENIVKVYDIEDLYRTMFIVMEYLDGISLEYLLKEKQKLTIPKVLNILISVFRGLQYAHERGIVHADIKPDNIFIQSDEQIKILDFGLACPAGTENIDMLGTLQYMSPEQIELLELDERTDIYSLGIVAYELLTGEKPYPEDDPIALMDLIVQQDVPDPSVKATYLPEVLRKFVLKACARDLEQRYQSSKAALKDLFALAETYGITENSFTIERRNMLNLFMLYKDEQQLALNELLEEFSGKVKDLGVVLKAADLKDF
jgi:predicted Ser/Thr protein kinase